MNLQGFSFAAVELHVRGLPVSYTHLGITQPDRGLIERGETVKIGYFSQENQALDGDKRVIKYIADISDNIKTSQGSFSASQMLERFLFPPHMHAVQIGRLSGGEKRCV